MFQSIWPSSNVKTAVYWKMLHFQCVGSGLISSFICGPIYAPAHKCTVKVQQHRIVADNVWDCGSYSHEVSDGKEFQE
jgi:hypothetical protein